MSTYIAANSCSASCCSLASAKLVNKGDQPERQEPAIYVEYYACTCSRYAGHSSCWQRRGTSQDCGFRNQPVAILVYIGVALFMGDLSLQVIVQERMCKKPK